MKLTTKFLLLLLGVGLFYSIYRLFTGHGGSGLEDFFDGLGYTSVFLFFAALTIIIINVRNVKRHLDTFLFLLLGLPMTIMAGTGIVQSMRYNRMPDLTALYPRPVDQKIFNEDSLHIAAQVDSLTALKNRQTHGIKVISAYVDTIIYSQDGQQVFVIYAEQFEPNDLGNDLDPAYLSADERDSAYWHLQEGTPNAEQMSGSYHNIMDLKNAVRKFYFNRYSFLQADSLKENYFWKPNAKR